MSKQLNVHLGRMSNILAITRRKIRSSYVTFGRYLDPASNLNARSRSRVSRLQLNDLAGRTPYWLAVLANACIAVWAFGIRDNTVSHWITILWTLGLIGTLISYALLARRVAQLPEEASPKQVDRLHLVWCAWLTVVAAIWLSGNEVLAHQPAPYGKSFDLAQQTFVYLTIIGQFISVMCFSPSVLAIFGVIVVANLLPFELHIIHDLKNNNPALSLLNTHVFFTGQLVMFLVVGWFFSISQKRFYIRQVLLWQERAQSEAERGRADAERIRANNFITAVGHDLKQPLQATALRLRTLKKKAAGSSELLETIDELERQNLSLHEMVDASFDLSRLNAGTWNVEVRESLLSNILCGVLDEFRYQASQKGVILESDPILPMIVRTDPDALGRIIRNLVSNAIKYTPAVSGGQPGRVAISCRQEDAFVVISIVDNGIGIPPDRARDIFEPYLQLGNPARDRTKGFGLGLSIVDRLIRLLDGHSISLEQPNDRGSRFVLRLPFLARIPDEMPDGNRPPDLNGMKVLIVEDFASVRDAISEQLIDLGCCVYDGSTSAEVIQNMRGSGDSMDPPQFIVADYRLAEGIEAGAHTGIDAIKDLRREFNENVPAVIWTAETEPELLQLVAVEGLEVLSKGPRMFDELVTMLGRIYREQKANNEAAA